MKVGILTFHQTANYGAMLQAYALWKVIRDLGHDVEIVDYQPMRSTLEYLKGMLWSKHPIRRIKQYCHLQNFIKKFTAIGKHTYRNAAELKSISRRYDIMIAGSDEIWNLEKPFIGFDPAYFLNFVDRGVFKASYAASFGNTTELNGTKKHVEHLLARFDFISVRDANSALLVESCGRTAGEVLDPTCLIDYSALEMPRFIKQPYLLLYTYRMSQEERRFVQYIAKQKKLLVVSAGNSDSSANLNRIDASVEEWLTLFKYASYVVTSYFHGAVFSILYRKPFNVFNKSSKMLKMDDLLGKMRLPERAFNREPFSEQIGDIDYQKTEKYFRYWRYKSQAYLDDLSVSLQKNTPNRSFALIK